MHQESMSIVERGNAAIVNARNPDTVVFESGNVYKLYGKKTENKVKRVGEQDAPDFEHWDDYHFQRRYSYLGEVKVVRVKRTLKLQFN
ncbi:hypothetical protein [Litoribrevibacter albus]|uniref:Uncharacterized protein n=1 Tax=Litoribrevibacter albus TaxID=1473156 RepID=A0AA37W6B3_9GAMM|nr:hypothetical protein [Litoribrevibacter albus]GLQ31435.1 hypothetical protein GCM10007876_19140 [Litoribrevibacter albus]